MKNLKRMISLVLAFICIFMINANHCFADELDKLTEIYTEGEDLIPYFYSTAEDIRANEVWSAQLEDINSDMYKSGALKRYYVDDKAFFAYYTGCYSWEINEISPSEHHEKALVIFAFSKDFVKTRKEIIVPDEISGEKFDHVVIRDYAPLEKIVLSDGIKRFTCSEYYSDLDMWGPDRIANPVKSLHLGKDFLADGLDADGYDTLENLEEVTVSKDNPNINSYKKALYSENYRTLIHCPAKYKSSTFRLHKSTTEIGEDAFICNKNIKTIKGISRIKKIGISAFEESKGIKKITFSKNLKELPENAFRKSNIEKVTFYGNIKKIGGRAFEKSKIKKVVVKNKISFSKRVGAFYKCRYVQFFVKNKYVANKLKPLLNAEFKNYGLNHYKIFIGKKLYLEKTKK